MLMKTLRYAVSVGAALVLCACAGGRPAGSAASHGGPAAAAPGKEASAPAPRPATQQVVGLDWYDLFDGKTLRNWKITQFGGHGTPTVTDGVLIIPMPAGGDMSGVTWAGPPLPKYNYEISLDAKRIDGGDFFLGLTFPVGDSHASLILGGWGGSVCGISCLDFEDASRNETTTTHEFKKDQWYSVRVRVFREGIQAFLDDEKIVDVNTKGRKVDVRMECEPCKPLGIATWNTAGAYRSIRMRLLTEDEIKTAPARRDWD